MLAVVVAGVEVKASTSWTAPVW